MTIWSVLKLPKIAWPSPFKDLQYSQLWNNRSLYNIILDELGLP